ncbi:MAG: zinc ribbon domain-containing protein [Candidatus Hodarchaeota archaeon]
MKYKRNQYSEGFSICALIIAGAFLYWGINEFINWGDGFEWWGFISTGIGISILVSQIYAITNRSKLRNVVLAEFQVNPEATVDDISISTGISRKDINAIVLDLKASGQLRGKFNTTTGQIKHLSIPKTEEVVEERAKYCPNCGTPITKDTAQFCSYCGTQI